MMEHVLKRIPLERRRNPAAGFILTLLCRTDPSFSGKAGKYADLYRELHHENRTRALKKDLIKTFVREDFTPDEYVDFSFFGKKPEERQEYVSLSELRKLFSKNSRNTFPKNKYDRYLLARKYFRREVIRFRFDGSDREKEDYRRFTAAHDAFIVKPVKGTKGHGITILFSAEYPEIDVLARKYQCEVLLEELIRQGEELGQFHPASVNTLRLATGMNADGQFVPLFALFRCGRGDSMVDNVGSGGIVCQADLESGIIQTDGLYDHRYYEIHPDTQIRFRGARIPEWQDLLAEAEEAHRSLPQQTLIGWDFAWSETGWDLVEINPAPSFASCQALSGKGIRPLLKQYRLL